MIAKFWSATPRLSGMRALVTGASGGIGGAVARRLAAGGAALALQGRRPERLGPLAGELGAAALIADFRDAKAPIRLVEDAVRALGGLDAVVSAAGMGWAGPLEEMPPDTIEEMIVVNLLAPLQLARAAIPYLRASSRPALVFVASIAGHLGVRQEAAYSAAKAGLIALGEALAEELSPTRVSVVSPGVVDTSFFERRGRPYGRRHPKPISPQRIAHAVVSCLDQGKGELIVPRWLRVAAAVRAIAPGLYRRLAIHLG